MAWCREATSHYLNPCWPRSMSPYGVTRPQWVNLFWPHDVIWHQWRHMASRNNIGSGKGWFTASNKPIPQPMLTNNHWGLVAFTWGQFHRKCSRHLFLLWVWKLLIKIIVTFPGGQWVNLSPPSICIYAPVIQVCIGSDNGLSPIRRQAIIWTSAGL